jgi:hypothetical protein
MKFAAFALFLGCSVVAVQSKFNLFDLQPLTPAGPPLVGQMLERLRFVLPPVGFEPAIPPVTAFIPSPRMIPQLSKGETLTLIAGAAKKYRVPAAFVSSIVAAESNFNCAAISPKGAIGLMQLMPDTAQEYGVDPTVPAENIDGGTRYLRWLMKRYEKRSSSLKHVIAAYNTGPGVVDRYRGVPPYRETRSYVARVLTYMKQFSLSRKRADS